MQDAAVDLLGAGAAGHVRLHREHATAVQTHGVGADDAPLVVEADRDLERAVLAGLRIAERHGGAGVREAHADRNRGLSRLLLDLGTRVVVAHGVVGER